LFALLFRAFVVKRCEKMEVKKGARLKAPSGQVNFLEKTKIIGKGVVKKGPRISKKNQKAFLRPSGGRIFPLYADQKTNRRKGV